MRESSYKKSNSLFHGKSGKMIKTTKENVVHEDKCEVSPKNMGGEGTN
jgi:hypothetical protein